MKAYIGPYRQRWVSYVHDKYMDKKYGVQWEDSSTKFEHFLEKLEDGLQWFYNSTINQIVDRRSDQKIKVRIDKWDTWSMDHTLSHIIVPMLTQLKVTKQGVPWVDDEDVPEHLRQIEQPADEVERSDENYERLHAAWGYVLDEMIWAFEQKCRDDWMEDFYYNKWDREGVKAHQDRMSNGFRLFGKYYEALWD